MIPTLMAIANEVFVLVVLAAIAAAPLALLVLVIDGTLSRRMAPRYRCLLWTLVAARLLMPAGPESVFSLQNAWRGGGVNDDAQDAYAIIPGQPADRNLTGSSDWYGVWAPADGPAPTPVSQPAALAPRGAGDWQAALWKGLSFVWLIGASVIALRALIASIRFARTLRRLPRVEDQTTIALLSRVCTQVGVKRRPPVKYVPELSAPALFGALRPTLCLPEPTQSQLSDDQLRMIMLHEMTHARRRDGCLSWLLTAVQAVQWFNPLAWFAVRKVVAYRELACDEAVRHFTAPSERPVYTELLVCFAARGMTTHLGIVGMCFARPLRHLSARIEAFDKSDIGRRRIPRWAAALLMGLLATTGLTDSASSRANDEKKTLTIGEFMQRTQRGASGRKSSAIAPHAVAFSAQSDANGPDANVVEERVYDIAEAVRQLAKVDPDVNSKRWLLTYLKLPSLKLEAVRYDGENPHHIYVTMTRRGHALFTEILKGISRSGPWQVFVEARALRTKQVETLGDVDWREAVKFARSVETDASGRPDSVGNGAIPELSGQDGVAVVSETVSWDYVPYLAALMNENEMNHVIDRLQADPRSSLGSCPKVTVFNGQRASMYDESFSPFVVGVHYVGGELSSAAQPDVVVLPTGTRLDVQPQVIDADSLDLKCRLTVSFVDDVDEIKLPGQNVVVQNPRASRQTITARCRIAPGETLLLAPNAGNNGECLFYAITAEWQRDEPHALPETGDGLR